MDDINSEYNNFYHEMWQEMSDAERARFVRVQQLTPEQIKSHFKNEELSSGVISAIQEAQSAIKIVESMKRDIVTLSRELFPELKIPEDCDYSTWLGDFVGKRAALRDIIHPTFSKKLNPNTPQSEQHIQFFRDALRDEVERRKREVEKVKNLDRLELTRYQPLARANNLRFSCTNINKLFVEAWMPDAMKDFSMVKDSLEGLRNKKLIDAIQYKTAYVGRSKTNTECVIGFKYDLAPEMKETLEKESALLTKAHYILSERLYEQTSGQGTGLAAITLNQFCDDLGMPRKKGAHSPKNKERARVVFDLLTSARVSALAQVVGKKDLLRVSDNMWKQGPEVEPQKRGRWEEIILTFERGTFDDEWYQQNKKFVGYVHRGFLELKADNKDKYAILLGGYLASFAKMDKYRIKAMRLLPILKKIGLWGVYGANNPGRMREKLERSLEQLIEVGILREFRIVELTEVKKAVKEMSKAVNYEEEYEEIDDNEHEAEPDEWVKLWLNKRLIYAHPFDLEDVGKANMEKREKHIKRNQSKKKKNVFLSANRGSQKPNPPC